MAFGLDDTDSIGHIVLGYSAWTCFLYIFFYEYMLQRTKFNWLFKFWLGYIVTQCIKCPFVVETNQVIGDKDIWPDIYSFINLVLAQFVAFFQILTWITLLFLSGNEYIKNAKKYRLVVYLICTTMIIYVLVAIGLYLFHFDPNIALAFQLLNASLAGVLFSWIAWIYTLICARKKYLKMNEDDNEFLIQSNNRKDITIPLLWITVFLAFIGVICGMISGGDGLLKLGKAPYGLFVVFPQTYCLLYLSKKFENYKVNPFSSKADGYDGVKVDNDDVEVDNDDQNNNP